MVDAFADGPPAAGSLSGDVLGAAELKGALTGLNELGSGVFPCESGHRWLLGWGWGYGNGKGEGIQ